MLHNKYKYLLTFIFCSLFTILFILGVFFNTISENPFKLNVNIDNKLFTFVPQGWAFFTRNPREAQIVLYQKKIDGQICEIAQKHSSYKNIYGLNRSASKIMSELQFIKSKINDTLYTNTKWNYQEKIYGFIPDKMVTVKNQMKNPILLGEYIVVYQRTIPWAWIKNIKKIKMPAKVIKIKIIDNDGKN